VASKGPSPVLGFNTNVRHKGKVFHIQTEDSGLNHPHIITHLFADGGRILKSKKTPYTQHAAKADVAEIVRKMMQVQHKEMFLLLQSGAFDEPAAAAPGGGNGGTAAAVSAPEPAPAPVSADPAVAAAPVPAPAQAPAAAAPSKAPAPPPGKTPSQVDVRPVIDLTPGRYSSTRAPEIFTTPDKAAPSLFGEEHISEKSLDEVIMSYLAEDLGED
jgi:hypothetical protein